VKNVVFCLFLEQKGQALTFSEKKHLLPKPRKLSLLRLNVPVQTINARIRPTTGGKTSI
jgi:hypothetical protein